MHGTDQVQPSQGRLRTMIMKKGYYICTHTCKESAHGSGPRCQSSGVKNTLAIMQGRSGSHWLKDRLVALHYPELAYLLRA
ncbi:hypothetical protein PISMIDRAFT_690508 [Pisolithus microcarpus 441]|uniref:Uncharacterized protein n=1 Tax=Pisolithus microcarpus 441 TaxID=765257 RepID=A0A0C9YB15_9AGAM|nr:hypothetical protein BKA83DRAFT_684806 [Pisolithus microcarpus]KIK11199.1 hypothetical protein PISMIDRAFT_690508 [Pisolithus microcarpus 441]